jgi:O-antigen/teichoic acid export membrane protein
MSKTRLAMKNTAIQAVSQVLTWTLTWILLVLLPRYLGDSQFGKFFFALSYGTIFSTLINLGVNTFLVKQVAILRPAADMAAQEITQRRIGLHALLSNVLAFKLALAAAVYVIQSGLIFFLPYDSATREAVLIIGLGTCLGAVTQTLGGAFQGLEYLLAPSLILIVDKAIITAGCALLLWQGYTLAAVCWVHTAAAGVGLVLSLSWLYRRERFGVAWDWQQLRRIFVGGLPFLIWVVFGEIYIRIDVLMLSLMTSDAVVGWYGAATRLYGTLLFIPNILTTSIFPAMMRMGSDTLDAAAFSRASERLMNLVLFAAIPISAGTIAVANPLVRLLYGSGPFEHAGPNLQILGLSILLVCIDVLLGTSLIARGKEKPWAGMAVAAALFNPLINLWAIPLAARIWGNGGIGAAAATALTELLMMFGALRLMPRGVFSRRNVIAGLKGGVLAAAMLLLLRWWGTEELVLLIPAGAAFYLPLALLWNVLPREDVHHLWHALRRGRP